MEVGRNISINYIECSLGSKFQFVFEVWNPFSYLTICVGSAQPNSCTYNVFHEHTSSVMGRRQKGKEAKTIEQKNVSVWNGSSVHIKGILLHVWVSVLVCAFCKRDRGLEWGFWKQAVLWGSKLTILSQCHHCFAQMTEVCWTFCRQCCDLG